MASSHAPHALIIAAAILHGLLTRDETVQEDELIEADAALAEAIAGMPGLFVTHLDFLGVLHGKEAQLSQHRRRNVSAALRDKAARLVRPPTEADFPPGHAVPLFALAYWGGVAAWSAGLAHRRQKPKGYWTSRANQIAAIQSLVARYPEEPITHALLHSAGLHRLGLTLNAAALQILVDEAGVNRNLRYRPSGWWTAERLIDVYAEACRKAGMTLSTTALSAIGGEASALRGYAKAHFATFSAFQRSVVARHSDIRLPKLPVAADGTALDSWGEVAVYQALRLALPSVCIKTHIILPGERKRSADFVIDDRVYVEVLGVACDAMDTSTSTRTAKYAAQWRAKSVCYLALGINPALIEPSDVHDPTRLAVRIADIAARLQLDSLPPILSGDRCTRAKGVWTHEMLCAAVQEVARNTGVIPTHKALASAGFGHACSLLKQPGMRERVAAALGLRDGNRRGVWTRERVVAGLAEWLRKRGTYPTGAALKRTGHGALGSARSRLWAGNSDALREAVAVASGVTVMRRRAPNRSYATVEQVATALTPLAKQLGRMPTGKEAAAAGLGTAWAHASRRGGVVRMAEQIGVPCRKHRSSTRPEMLAEFSRLSASLGSARLTTTIIRARLGSGGIARVRRCGGVDAVRTAVAGMSGREVSNG